MKKKSWITALLILSVAFCMAAAVDLSGKWTGTLEMQGGSFPLTYNFKVDGEKLTGTVEGPDGPVDIDSGVIKNNDFKFNVTLQSGDVIHNTGKYYGDSTTIDFVAMGNKAHMKLLRAK
jgi:hypothetical protein